MRDAGAPEGAPLTPGPSGEGTAGADVRFRRFFDHRDHPRHVGQTSRVDGVGEAADPLPGRSIRVTFALDRLGAIEDIAYRTDAHGATLAACSILAEMAIGKRLCEVLWITPEELAARLGPLPPGESEPLPIFQQALARAETDTLPGPRSHLADDELVCWCFHRTAGELRRAIREQGLCSVDEVREATRATGGCGTCRPEVKSLLREAGRDVTRER